MFVLAVLCYFTYFLYMLWSTQTILYLVPYHIVSIVVRVVKLSPIATSIYHQLCEVCMLLWQVARPIYEDESKQLRCLNAQTLHCCAYNQRTVLIVCSKYWQVCWLQVDPSGFTVESIHPWVCMAPWMCPKVITSTWESSWRYVLVNAS